MAARFQPEYDDDGEATTVYFDAPAPPVPQPAMPQPAMVVALPQPEPMHPMYDFVPQPAMQPLPRAPHYPATERVRRAPKRAKLVRSVDPRSKRTIGIVFASACVLIGIAIGGTIGISRKSAASAATIEHVSAPAPTPMPAPAPAPKPVAPPQPTVTPITPPPVTITPL